MDKKDFFKKKKESCSCKGVELQVADPVFGKTQRTGTEASGLETIMFLKPQINFC